MSKVEGLYLNEFMSQIVLPLLAKNLSKDEVYVILYDIDPYCRDADFWETMPKIHGPKFKEDFVILKCSSLREATKIVTSLNPSFARSILVTNEVNL